MLLFPNGLTRKAGQASPSIPEHKPEQGFPMGCQADQGHWAGTRTEVRLLLCGLNGESPRPSGGVHYDPKLVEPHTGEGVL